MILDDLVSGLLTSLVIILFRNTFYKLAVSSTSLLDSIFFETNNPSVKLSLLNKNLKNLIKSLFFFLVYIIFIIASFFTPFFLTNFFLETSKVLDLITNLNIIFFAIGSIIPFLIITLKSKSQYGELSKLFHKIVLENYNIAHKLLDLQTKNIESVNNEFIIVSGLARSGTTALTRALTKSQKLKSLDYSSMPFIICPKVWSKFYKPKSNKSLERKHNDNIFISYSSVEALDEYFFKIQLNDSYVKESVVELHNITELQYQKYLKYQKSIADDKIYLTKNNNFLLRYKSFRKLNKRFKFLVCFREPISHANSLLNQHLSFTKLQKKDPFILEYMNWLGHYEFGLNQKQMNFNNNIISYDKNDVNYWISLWINYYEYLIRVHDKSLILIEFEN
ncbi:hypothetical protein OBA38_00785, partial [bacterium]|nr:hypothetical protein [bacterium]